MSRFQFVADHRDTFEVKRLCTTVEIGRSSFYAWLAGAPAREQRRAADDGLAERIRLVHTLDAAYGAPRVTAELNDPASPVNAPAVLEAVRGGAGVEPSELDTGSGSGSSEDQSAYVTAGCGPVNHKRIARVMRERHLVGLRLRRKVRTTIPAPDATPVPDLLERDFTAPEPNLRYVGDITYLPFDGGNLYLATVIDCYSRRLVGWSIAEHMRTDLVIDALRAAQLQRGSLSGAIFHSDHGAQYGARDYAALCHQLGVSRSMGAVGSSADNALAESFNASLKRETLQGATRWDTAQQARLAVFAWITRYNTHRRHSACGQLSPNTYENTSTPVTLRPAA